MILDSYSLRSSARVLNIDVDDLRQLLLNGTIRGCVSFDDYTSREPSLVFFNERFDFESLPAVTQLELLGCSSNNVIQSPDSGDFIDRISTGESDEFEEGVQLSYFDADTHMPFPELSRLTSTGKSKLNVERLDMVEGDSAYVTGAYSGLWQIKSLSMIKQLLRSDEQTIGVQFVPVIENALYYSTMIENLPFIYDGFLCEITTSDIRLLREDVERIWLALANGGVIQPLSGEPWVVKPSRVRAPSAQAITVIRQLIESNVQLGTNILDHPTKAKEKIDQYLARQGLPPLKVGDSTFSNWLTQTR